MSRSKQPPPYPDSIGFKFLTSALLATSTSRYTIFDKEGLGGGWEGEVGDGGWGRVGEGLGGGGEGRCAHIPQGLVRKISRIMDS